MLLRKWFFAFFFFLYSIVECTESSLETLDLQKGSWVEEKEDPLLSGDFAFTIVRIFDGDTGEWKFNWPRLFIVDGEKIDLPKESPLHIEYDGKGRISHLSFHDRPDKNNGKNNGKNDLSFSEVVVDPTTSMWEIRRGGALVSTYTFSKNLLSKITYATGRKIEYRYLVSPDAKMAPRIASVVEDLQETLYQYDANERLSSVIRPSSGKGTPGHKIALSYGDSKTMVDEGPFGKRIYTYNKNQQVQSIETQEGTLSVHQIYFEWDKNRLLKKTLLNPITSETITYFYIYNKEGELIEERVEKNGTSFSHLLHYKGARLAKENTFFGETITYTWDPSTGALLDKKIEGGLHCRYAYNSSQQIAEESIEEGPHLYRKILSESPDGLLKEEIHTFDGETTMREKKLFSENGLLLLEEKYDEEDELREQISFNYDQEGRLIEKNTLQGESQISLWGSTGNLEQLIQDGEEYAFHYDGLGRLISEASGAAFRYDAKGRKIAQIDSEGNETTFVYNVLDQIIEVQGPKVLNEKEKAARPIFRFRYDLLGQVIETIDPLEYKTLYIRDGRGKVEKILFPDGSQELYQYDSNGKLASIQKRDHEVIEKKNAPSLQPKKLPQKSPMAENSPEKKSITRTSTYNAMGQKVKQTRFVQPNGIESVRTYDTLGRVVSIDALDASQNLLERQEMRYTLSGDLALMKKGTFTLRKTFGPMHRVEKVEEKRGELPEMTTHFYYDERGLLTQIVKNDRTALYYLYDAQGRISKIDSSDKSVHHTFCFDSDGRIVASTDLLGTNYRTYDEEGHLLKEILSHGEVIQKNWNSDGRVSSLSLGRLGSLDYHYSNSEILVSRKNSSKEELFQKKVVLNEAGRLLSLGDQLFSYNEEGKLLSITSPHEEQSLLWNGEKLMETKLTSHNRSIHHTYGYDALFRVNQEDDQLWEYDAFEKRQSRSQKTAPLVEYDAVGNVKEIRDGFLHLFLEYDALGRLVRVKDDHKEYQYIYDAFNRRIAKESEGETIFYLYDALFEIGSCTKERLLDLKFALPNSLITLGLEWEGKIFDIHSDYKNSPIALIGEGDPIYLDYDVWGRSKELTSPFGYCGKRADPETGFLYFGSRFYAPLLATFITPDPKGTIDGLNPYHFAHFNPLYYSDPFGNSSFFDSFVNFFDEIYQFFKKIGNTISGFYKSALEKIGLNRIWDGFHSFFENFLGKGFLLLNGNYIEEAHSGIFGEKEIHDKVRVTFMHGILTLREHLTQNLEEISQTHGEVRVHYVFRPSKGFTRDLLQCMLVKMGWVSEESKELLKIWKNLIEEMGGTAEGGKIVHYAHSLGGADTLNALSLLTQDEQMMIDIHTFGSAALIQNTGTYNAVNYVSKRDGVPLFDPIRYWHAWFGGTSNIQFVGNAVGIPFVDHLMIGSCYHDIMKNLGQAFVTLYGTATL